MDCDYNWTQEPIEISRFLISRPTVATTFTRKSVIVNRQKSTDYWRITPFQCNENLNLPLKGILGDLGVINPEKNSEKNLHAGLWINCMRCGDGKPVCSLWGEWVDQINEILPTIILPTTTDPTQFESVEDFSDVLATDDELGAKVPLYIWISRIVGKQ